MNASPNPEIYSGSRGQTIADLFSYEVTDPNAEARKQVLQTIQQTSRSTEAGSGYELPMFFINTEAAELVAPTALATKPREFDLIRM